MAKPIYTQEMYDNGELPRAGMECLVLNTNCTNPKYIKGLIKYIGSLVIYAYVESGERCDNLKTLEFKPLAPPVELINNEPYEFDYHTGSTGMQGAVMRYSKAGDYFFFDNTIFRREYCTNIKLLTV
tara:strand:- start:702 stop:1082 length:381 start_codon:yes stop_codon:yes gene_type:complete